MASFQPQYPGLGLAASPTAPVALPQPMPMAPMQANQGGFGQAPMQSNAQPGPAVQSYLQGLSAVMPQIQSNTPNYIPMETAKVETQKPAPVIQSAPAKTYSTPEIVDNVGKGLTGLKSIISPATGAASGATGAGVTAAGAGTGAAAAGTTAASTAAAGLGATSAATGAAAGTAAAGGSAATAAGLGTAGAAAGLGAAGAAGLATGGIGALAGLGVMGLMALLKRKKPDEASIGA